MVEISDELLCLYTEEVDAEGEKYTIEVPKREVDKGEVTPNETHQVAILSHTTQAPNDGSQPTTQSVQADSPPVAEDDVIELEIESIGDQGDGIGRVGPGYVIIVPDTEVGDRVSVKITNAKDNVAFGEAVEWHQPPY